MDNLRYVFEWMVFSPGILWMDLDKIATKGFSSELSSTRSHKPQKKIHPNLLCGTFWILAFHITRTNNAVWRKWKKDILPQPGEGWIFFGNCRHLEEMHCHKKPFVAILSHSGPDLGYNTWTILGACSRESLVIRLYSKIGQIHLSIEAQCNHLFYKWVTTKLLKHTSCWTN